MNEFAQDGSQASHMVSGRGSQYDTVLLFHLEERLRNSCIMCFLPCPDVFHMQSAEYWGSASQQGGLFFRAQFRVW
jgi:hypothetical protein